MDSAVDDPAAHAAGARPSARRWARPALIGVTLILAAVLIFAGLGHYAFWDDEAGTGLSARAILETGGNNALIDHGNFVAYHDGNALRGFRNVVEPLLPAYLTAASFTVFGQNAWAGRLPFALLGLGTFALVLFWTRQERWQVLAVLAVALLGNVSLLLFVRNCRYYAPAIFLSAALAYLYCRRKGTYGSMMAFAALSILLFTSNYLDYIAFYVCLAVDYLVWRRRHSPLHWRLLLCALLPQVVCNGIIGAVWNPLRTTHAAQLLQNSLWDKLTLFYWQWRDMNACEFLCLPLLLATLVVGLTQRRASLVRGCAALVTYVVVITVISPQIVQGSTYADVRYLVPLIPLAVGLEVATLCVLLGKRTALLFAAALAVFGTNFVHGGFVPRRETRSTLVSYVTEIAYPFPDPYGPTADWINKNVPAGGTVWVHPNAFMYPLMFHAPAALYAWQMTWPPRPGYEGLPLIHFEGKEAPAYVVAFGPNVVNALDALREMHFPGVRYQPVAVVNIFWRDLHRPELFWHAFEPVTHFDPAQKAIYIFQRTAVPAAAGRGKNHANLQAGGVQVASLPRIPLGESEGGVNRSGDGTDPADSNSRSTHAASAIK